MLASFRFKLAPPGRTKSTDKPSSKVCFSDECFSSNFSPFLVSICKKETKFCYDKSGKLEEKTTLGFSFTVDFRFIDTKTIKGFIEELKRIGENPDIFEEEMKKASRS